MQCKIYKPAKTAMQSGLAKTEQWVLEGEAETARRPEEVMGWTEAGDTLTQVRLKFDTKEAAIAFAEKEGWDYACAEAHDRKVIPRSYTDNFKYRAADQE